MHSDHCTIETNPRYAVAFASLRWAVLCLAIIGLAFLGVGTPAESRLSGPYETASHQPVRIAYDTADDHGILPVSGDQLLSAARNSFDKGKTGSPDIPAGLTVADLSWPAPDADADKTVLPSGVLWVSSARLSPFSSRSPPVLA